MENISIQEIWKQNEVILEQTRALNLKVLKEVKLGKVKSTLKNLLFLPVSTLVFYTSVASYGLYFAIQNVDTWYFMFSGAVVAFFSALYILSSIKQLKQLLLINYDAPVLEMQTELSKIKLSVVTNLRIAAYMLAFGPFIGLFVLKVLFNIDMVLLLNSTMMISFGVVTVLLEILSLMLLRALHPKNMNKKWLNWLLKGNGSQVDEAIGFINEMKRFEAGMDR